MYYIAAIATNISDLLWYRSKNAQCIRAEIRKQVQSFGGCTVSAYLTL